MNADKRNIITCSFSNYFISKTSLRKILICLILGLSTGLASCIVDKYIETGPQLLVDPIFTNDLDAWQVSGTNSFVDINSASVNINLHEPMSSIQISQQLVPRLLEGKVILKGSVKAVAITGGNEGWDKGRVVLVQFVEGKAIYSTPHVLVALSGTNNWAEYSKVFTILPKTSEASVSIQLSHCTGELQVKDLSLYRVQVNPVYGVVRLMVFGLGALFMICVFLPGVVRRLKDRTSSVVAVLIIAAIILGTTAPASLKNDAKSEIINHAKTSADKIIEYGGTTTADFAAKLNSQKWLKVDITKVAHFLLFGLLGSFLCFRRGEEALWQTLADIAILACGSELMQLFIEGRSSLVGDVLIDLAGAACGIVLATKYRNEH